MSNKQILSIANGRFRRRLSSASTPHNARATIRTLYLVRLVQQPVRLIDYEQLQVLQGKARRPLLWWCEGEDDDEDDQLHYV